MYHTLPSALCFHTWRFLLQFYCFSSSFQQICFIYLSSYTLLHFILSHVFSFPFYKHVSARLQILISNSFNFILILLLYLCFSPSSSFYFNLIVLIYLFSVFSLLSVWRSLIFSDTESESLWHSLESNGRVICENYFEMCWRN